MTKLFALKRTIQQSREIAFKVSETKISGFISHTNLSAISINSSSVEISLFTPSYTLGCQPQRKQSIQFEKKKEKDVSQIYIHHTLNVTN